MTEPLRVGQIWLSRNQCGRRLIRTVGFQSYDGTHWWCEAESSWLPREDGTPGTTLLLIRFHSDPAHYGWYHHDDFNPVPGDPTYLLWSPP